MKSILFIPLAFLGMISCKKNTETTPTNPGNTDSFSVTVNNGFGNGMYKAGDTVHIFSANYADNQSFGTWTGDVSLLSRQDEWHTWFIMPNKNVSFSAHLNATSPISLQYEQLMGKNILKPVYYYFPTTQQGIIYLLHGTNGNAANIANTYEWHLLIKDLVNNNYAVIITECEEATLGTDNNGDGKLRWSLLPADTTANADYANIRILTDSFIHRGFTSASLPKYSIGMSDGGFFSAAVAYLYHFKASVQYCAQGSDNIMQTTTIPTRFCMEANDDNASVGMAGNAEAYSNYNSLTSKGICSQYNSNLRSPLYTDRFARNGIISSPLSLSLFNELKSQGYIDSRNYFVGTFENFSNTYQANPPQFPIFNGLTYAQKLFVQEQINISLAVHHMYSDCNRATLEFLNKLCQ